MQKLVHVRRIFCCAVNMHCCPKSGAKTCTVVEAGFRLKVWEPVFELCEDSFENHVVIGHFALQVGDCVLSLVVQLELLCLLRFFLLRLRLSFARRSSALLRLRIDIDSDLLVLLQLNALLHFELSLLPTYFGQFRVQFRSELC